MAELVAAPELDMELVAVSTDSLEVHRVWRERREAGGPGVMVGDRTGQVARSFGVLDNANVQVNALTPAPTPAPSLVPAPATAGANISL